MPCITRKHLKSIVGYVSPLDVRRWEVVGSHAARARGMLVVGFRVRRLKFNRMLTDRRFFFPPGPLSMLGSRGSHRRFAPVRMSRLRTTGIW